MKNFEKKIVHLHEKPNNHCINMKIEIDKESGFCFGVVRAIETAETELEKGQPLYCLGDIVHNEQEVKRLSDKGLITITHAQLDTLDKKSRILLRAHGEPPTTYQKASQVQLQLTDATCPVVLRLQMRIKQAFKNHPSAQIVIYGKKGHAEVNGLVGQTNGKAIVIEKIQDIDQIDYSKPVLLFSQTTKSLDLYNQLASAIKDKMQNEEPFEVFDTICRQVANRIPNIQKFAKKFDLVFFVSGKKSSNGKILCHECQQVNANTYHISSPEDIQKEWLINIDSIGICGATSTPKWLMEAVSEKIQSILN